MGHRRLDYPCRLYLDTFILQYEGDDGTSQWHFHRGSEYSSLVVYRREKLQDKSIRSLKTWLLLWKVISLRWWTLFFCLCGFPCNMMIRYWRWRIPTRLSRYMRPTRPGRSRPTLLTRGSSIKLCFLRWDSENFEKSMTTSPTSRCLFDISVTDFEGKQRSR
jgi:hypothetical protein